MTGSPMTRQEHQFIINRQRRLPSQIRAVRIKLQHLLMEAETYALGPFILDHEYRGDRAAMEADKNITTKIKDIAA